MKLKEFVKELQALEQELPKAKDSLEIIFASDEEGNSFSDEADFGEDTIEGKRVLVLYPTGRNFTGD